MSKRKVVVVMPAYNASKTLDMTYNDIDRSLVDEIILVDDCSRDDTVDRAKRLPIKVVTHPKNMGYGANLKTCFREALKMGADIIIQLHPDYQYDPKQIGKMVKLLNAKEADMVLGSRILGGAALQGGMPVYKFLGNSLLGFIQNLAYGLNLSDYATGYKGYAGKALEAIPFEKNSDGFIFDEEINTQVVHFGFRLAQIPIPTKYFKEASTVNFITSLSYGIDILLLILKWFLHRTGIVKIKIFCKGS